MARKTPELDIAAMMKQRNIGGAGALAKRPDAENGAATVKMPKIIKTTVNFRPTPMKKG